MKKIFKSLIIIALLSGCVKKTICINLGSTIRITRITKALRRLLNYCPKISTRQKLKKYWANQFRLALIFDIQLIQLEPMAV